MGNTSTAQAKLKELTEAIVKAVPDVLCKICDECRGVPQDCCPVMLPHPCCVSNEYQRAIILEDVLRAYRKKNGILSKMLLVNDGGWFLVGLEPLKNKIQWHLGLPLHQQSEETIVFLHSLLLDPEDLPRQANE